MPTSSRTLAEFVGAGAQAVKRAVMRTDLRPSVITHDNIDRYELQELRVGSPSWARTEESAPSVPVVAEPLPELDVMTATPEELREHQQRVREIQEREEEAPTYKRWPDLTGDLFMSYHSHERPQVTEEQVDPGVELHRSVMRSMMTSDEWEDTRNYTRDDPTLAAIAAMAASNAAKEVLETELRENLRESEEMEEKREEARDAEDRLESSREEAKEAHENGEPVPQPLVEEIKNLVHEKRAAQAQAAQMAENQKPLTLEALEGLQQAAAAGQEAAESGKAVPSFGAGLGPGEPIHTDPEKALSIAQQWSQGQLKKMAERFGRFKQDIAFHRSKRIEHANEEIVDVGFGDNLRRALPSELAMLADPDLEDLFYLKLSSGEMLEYRTEGEANAGRGPIVMCCDGSQSMEGEKNIWARAVAMCLLQIARVEKRDFAMVEFASAGQVEDWQFLAREGLDAERLLDMCSHFFRGGTTPVIGIERAAQIMRNAPEFKKADIVIVGDGIASFGPEDKRLRDELVGKGVRFFGIGIGGGQYQYIEQYCADGHVVSVESFELQDPSKATAELAVQIT